MQRVFGLKNKSTPLVVASFVDFLPFNVFANAYSAEAVPYVAATVGPDSFFAIEYPTNVLRILSMQICPFCACPCDPTLPIIKVIWHTNTY